MRHLKDLFDAIIWIAIGGAIVYFVFFWGR